MSQEGSASAPEPLVVKRSVIAKRRKPSKPVQNGQQQWRAREDRPISLTRQPAHETPIGQKALVVGFAAAALLGAAYFVSVMVNHERGRPKFLTANAVTQTSPAAAPEAPSSPLLVEQAAAAEVITESAAETATPSAPAVAPSAPAAESTAAAPVVDSPETTTETGFPAAVRVKTVSIPGKKVAAPAAAPKGDRVETEVAAVELSESASETPALNAYAGEDKAALVNEGIAAVLRVASAEDSGAPARTAKTKTASANSVADTPEMAGATNTRRIRSGVNMRAAPRSGSPVLGTIPTNAVVNVAPGCKQWCAVSYNGKRGYVYKSFLR